MQAEDMGVIDHRVLLCSRIWALICLCPPQERRSGLVLWLCDLTCPTLGLMLYCYCVEIHHNFLITFSFSLDPPKIVLIVLDEQMNEWESPHSSSCLSASTASLLNHKTQGLGEERWVQPRTTTGWSRRCNAREEISLGGADSGFSCSTCSSHPLITLVPHFSSVQSLSRVWLFVTP